MNFLFFISMFAVTVSSNPLSPLFSDPKAFVASLQNADPEVINKMLELVADLEQEGKDKQVELEEIAKNLRSIATQKAADLADAIDVLNTAQGALATATGTMNELTSAEAVQKAALEKAISERDTSQADADKKAKTLADVSARTDNEIAGFEKVIALLDDVVVEESWSKDKFDVQTGRNLLEAANADPDAIDQVKAKVQGLIDASNAEASAASDADAAAKADLDTKLATHESALEQHTATAGQLQSAIIDVDTTTATRNAAKVKKDEATRIDYAAEVDAADAEAFLASETVRIAEEADTLAEVTDLLKTLLPSED